MKIQPVSSPTAIQQTTSNASDSKARAIAAFTKAASAQATQPVVQNQNNVSPEELGAIKASSETDELIGSDTEELEAATEETVEAPKVEEPKTEDPALSRQFAQLARQEKALRAKVQQQDQALKSREAALAAREAELNAKDQSYKSSYISKDDLKNNSLQALADAGVSYEDLTQEIISQQPTDPRITRTIAKLEAKIQELESKNDTFTKSQETQKTEAYQAAVKQLTTDATRLVNSDPVAYEAISKTGTVKEVVKLIEETYKEEGYVMNVEDAAKQVEDYLVEENYNMATRIDKIKRRMQAVAPNASSSTAKTPAEEVKKTQPMKTLTNATSSQRQLSAKERAILAFKGELKS